ERLARDGACPEVPHVDDASHIVDATLADGETREAVLDHLRAVLRFGVLEIEPDHAVPRGHQLTDTPVAQREDALDQLPLLLREDARLRALADHRLDLLLRDRRLLGLAYAKQPDHPLRR